MKFRTDSLSSMGSSLSSLTSGIDFETPPLSPMVFRLLKFYVYIRSINHNYNSDLLLIRRL